MDIALITAIVDYLGETVSSLTTNAAIDSAIALLEKWLPTLLQDAAALAPQVEDAISILLGADSLTADQLATLTTLSNQVDAALVAAEAAANGGAS